MAEAVLRVSGLPADPLDAAAHFHGQVLAGIRDDRAGLPELNLVIVFDPAGHEHRGWRLAAVQGLAREAAPGRVNAIVGDDAAAIAAAVRYLALAPGVTGQLLPLDGTGAGEVLC